MKLKSLIYLIISIVLMVPSSAMAAESLTQKANTAYDADNYAEALKLYTEIAKTEGTSSNLFYNIGNTYYRMGNKGQAILFYERALQLNPQNDDARQNLIFVNSKIVDKTEKLDSNILAELIQNICNWQSSNGWAVWAAIFFILIVSSFMLYIFSSTVIFRKLGFFGGISLFVFFVISLSFAYSAKDRITKREYAIITSPSITLSTSPRSPKDKSEEAFILNEGTKVQILDSLESKKDNKLQIWYDVKADDSHRAWIEKTNLEII